MEKQISETKVINNFFFEAKLAHRNWYQGELNLRPWEDHTPRSQANTTRPTQVDSKVI